MANVAFKKGLLANLPASFAEGTFYVTTDERALYLDVTNGSRIRIGDFQEFSTLDELKKNVNPSTAALYYINSLNVLAKWTGTEYVQINLDTGATSFEVVGEGNAVTEVSYDAVTRKLTLTKGETFATKEELDALDAFVGEIPEGYSEENIVAYINKKAEETLTAANGGSSETAASVAAALDTFKAEVNPKVTANTEAIAAIKDGETIDSFKDVETAIDTLETSVEGNTTAIDELADKVGEVPADKTVVQMIADAQTAATYDDAEVWAELGALGDAVDLLNDGADVEGSVDYKIAQAVAAIMENPDETMNSINELVTWINGHAQDALELSNKVTANENDIAALEALIGEEDVATQIEEAIAEALNVEGGDKYALAADLTAAIARIAAMEAKVAAWDAAEQNAKDYADGLNTAMNARVEALEAIDHSHENADVLAGISAEKVAAWDAAQGNAEATAAAALSAAKLELESKIAAAQTAAEKVANDNNDAMDARVKVLEAIDHEAYVGADAQVLADAKAYTDAQIVANALAWGSF